MMITKKVIKKSKYSRLGCSNCKQRRLKCGEELDSCFNCLDKNLKCPYLSLTDEQKQKIIENNVNNPKWVKNSGTASSVNNLAVVLPMTESVIQAGNKNGSSDVQNGQNLYFNDFENMSATFKVDGKLRLLDDRAKTTKYTFGVIDFNKDQSLITNLTDFNSNSHPAVHDFKKNYNPLPNHLYLPTKFTLYSHKRNWCTRFTPTPTFDISGEQDNVLAHMRGSFAFWLQDICFEATHTKLMYYTMISRAITLLLSDFENFWDPTTLKTLTNLNVRYRGLGFQFAADTIDKLNQYSNFDEKNINEYEKNIIMKFLMLFKLIVDYSLVNLGLSLQYIDINDDNNNNGNNKGNSTTSGITNSSKNKINLHTEFSTKFGNPVYPSSSLTDPSSTVTNSSTNASSLMMPKRHYNDKEYKQLLAFANGLIFTSLEKQKFTAAYSHINNGIDNLPISYTESLVNVFSYYFINNTKLLFLPSYNLSPLFEFYEETLKFKDFLMSNNERFQINKKILQGLNTLLDFIKYQIIENFKLLNSYNEKFVTTYNITLVYEILKTFFDSLPIQFIIFNDTYKCFTEIEQLIFIHWYTTCALLDSIFPETQYFFLVCFQGGSNSCGFTSATIGDILNNFKQKILISNNNNDYHSRYINKYLLKKLIYLVRIESFLTFRYFSFNKQLEFDDLIPKTDHLNNNIADSTISLTIDTGYTFDRFKSRKPKFIREVQVKSFMNEVIKKENYFTDIRKTNPNTKFENLHNIKFAPLNENANVSSNYGKQEIINVRNNFNLNNTPIYLLITHPSNGLLMDLDYRPRDSKVGECSNSELITMDDISLYFRYYYWELKARDMMMRQYSEDKDLIMKWSATSR